MKYKNPNKNNELIALVKALKKKNIITEAEIKAEKEKLKNVEAKKE